MALLLTRMAEASVAAILITLRLTGLNFQAGPPLSAYLVIWTKLPSFPAPRGG